MKMHLIAYVWCAMSKIKIHYGKMEKKARACEPFSDYHLMTTI